MNVIVIGSGLGGLAAAAKLSREGFRVTVLEQHSIPGGYATTYRRKGSIFEVGLQETDGFDDADVKRRIFKDLGIGDELFVSLPSVSRVRIGTEDYVVPELHRPAVKALSEMYPKESQGIHRFYNVVIGIRDELCRLPLRRRKLLALLPLFPFLFPNLTLHLFSTLGRFLRRKIKDPTLRTILMTNLFYIHDDPESLSLLYFSGPMGGYYRGSRYIRGGSSRLTEKLVSIIEDSGGRVQCGCRVTAVEAGAGGAKTVRYVSNEEEQRLSAPIIIANNSPLVLADHMLQNKAARKRLGRRVSGRRPSMSFTQVNILFKRRLTEIGVAQYKTLMVHHLPLTPKDYAVQIAGDYSERPFIFTDYGQVESGLNPDGKSYGVVLIPDRASSWNDLSKKDYRSRKARISEIIIDRLEEVYPGISGEIDYLEIATPLTMERYTGNPEGAIYGFEQNPLGAGVFRLPIVSPMRGLYLASAWTYPGGGFTGALWSGWSCAHEILGREA